MSQDKNEGQRLISELSRSTGVNEKDVEKVLEEIGLSRVMSTVGEHHAEEQIRSITKDNLKLAVRFGKNTLDV